MSAHITLKPGRERSVLQRHPWVFSGAVSKRSGDLAPGAAVEVYAADGRWLARGTWSTSSQIAARLFSWDEAQQLDAALLRQRIERAFRDRERLFSSVTDAYRAIFAESDGLPGLIVDRFGAWLSVQLLTQGMAARAELITRLLAEVSGARGIYERSDADVRQKEGLAHAEGPLWGEPPPEQLVITEHGLRFGVSLVGGQKTGYYLDQRSNRQQVAAHCKGKDVLGVFTYSGGFEIHALAAGAETLAAVDSSAPALEQLRENLALNDLDPKKVELIEGDAFKVLRELRQQGRTFDVVILDPPKFAHSQAQVQRATRGYKDINMQALHLLRPGGVLATFSCSGLVSAELFQKVIFGAALDAGRDVQILEQLHQDADHPVLLTFPEAAYLKGLLCRVW